MLKKGLRILVMAAAAYGIVVAASKVKQKMAAKKAGSNPKDVKWLK